MQIDKHIEREFKTQLSHQEFLMMLDHYPTCSVVRQTNIYYDTRDHALSNQGIMLRIRNINNTDFLLTMKTPAATGNLEEECVLDHASPCQPEVIQFLHAHQLPDALIELTRSLTIRHETEDEYAMIALDETHFGTVVDYELEYELKDPNQSGDAAFNQLLHTHHLTYRPSEPKIKRALRYATRTR